MHFGISMIGGAVLIIPFSYLAGLPQAIIVAVVDLLLAKRKLQLRPRIGVPSRDTPSQYWGCKGSRRRRPARPCCSDWSVRFQPRCVRGCQEEAKRNPMCLTRHTDLEAAR
jgi:hypothetical protein